MKDIAKQNKYYLQTPINEKKKHIVIFWNIEEILAIGTLILEDILMGYKMKDIAVLVYHNVKKGLKV